MERHPVTRRRPHIIIPHETGEPMSKTKTSIKLDANRGRVNGGLAIGALLGAVVPIVATAATGGLAAVPVALWIGLGSVVSGLLAGNVQEH